MKKWIKQLLIGGPGGANWLADLGLMALRVFAGLALALAHGWGKFDPDRRMRFTEGVEGMGFPIPWLFAWAAILSEFIGGLLLAAGLLTRPASFFIAITMSVAAFIRHADDPFVGKERALLFLAIAVCFLLAGPGRFSGDHAIRKFAS